MEEMARAGGAGLFAKYIDDRPLYAQQLPSKPARVASLSKARAPLAVVCFLGLITLVIERAENSRLFRKALAEPPVGTSVCGGS
jgi:hypothetical protein